MLVAHEEGRHPFSAGTSAASSCAADLDNSRRLKIIFLHIAAPNLPKISRFAEAMYSPTVAVAAVCGRIWCGSHEVNDGRVLKRRQPVRPCTRSGHAVQGNRVKE
jgi:hypothetical protein